MDFATFTPYLPFVQTFALTLVPILFGLGVKALKDRNVNTTVIEAIGRAGGEAYLSVVKSGVDIRAPGAIQAAVAVGSAYMASRVPEALVAAGVTPEGAAQMVGAELGKLLAKDPTVAVTK